ncbi:hypothetical protein FWF48_03315 [Candidatus Saccharibacteria bacterium]|nr:hypothetical protein [Candidatus Saccharibacteria bacterium]
MFKQKNRNGIIVVAILVLSLLISITALAFAIPAAIHKCPAGERWAVTEDQHYQCIPDYSCGPGDEVCADKPIIYLYPTSETKVSVKLSHPENITAQYPDYNNGWNVIAQPNGDLREVGTGRELYALYYESRNIVPTQRQTDGFVIKSAATAEFLQQILPKLGLNARESEEFIVYWLPVLQQNKWNYIRFLTADEIDANQKLTVSPAPDTVIRVWMSYEPLNKPISVKPQQINIPARQGFIVVEWGGTRISEKATR